jgi:hypothetical protein
VMLILGWTSKERATASAMGLLGPLPDSSMRLLDVVCPCLAIGG